MSLMGIDVGTTGCKAVVYTVEGVCLAEAYREYETLRPRPGWAELDARDVFEKIRTVIAEAASAAGQDPVSALSVSALGEAMVPVSEDRKILGNAIVSSDLRGKEYIDRLHKDIGQEAFFAINANILSPGYSLPKLMWLRDNDSKAFSEAWKFLLWGDLVGFMLGGAPLTSYSLANRTLLFDIHRSDWSDTLLNWAGLDRDILPEAVPSGTHSGVIAPGIAAELGLPGNVAIIVGGHDQCCNALGAGLTRPNGAVCGIGTVECITPLYAAIPDLPAIMACGLNVEHGLLPGQYVSFLFNYTGALVRWFRDTFAQADKASLPHGVDIYTHLTAEMPDGPTSLLVLPHFEITGPPGYITDSAGVIAGLRTSTARGEILKAIMEGAAYYFVDNIEALRRLGIDTSEFIATGGGAKSDAWLQLKADIFGIPFVRPAITECSALGAAILAGGATGHFSSPAEGAAGIVRRDRDFQPHAGRHARYRECHGRYKQLYPAMGSLLAQMK